MESTKEIIARLKEMRGRVAKEKDRDTLSMVIKMLKPTPKSTPKSTDCVCYPEERDKDKRKCHECPR